MLALTVPAGCGTTAGAQTTGANPATLPSPSAAASASAAAQLNAVPPSPSASVSASASAKPSAKASEAKASEVEEEPTAAKSDGRGGPVPFTPGKAMLGSYLALGGKSLKQSLALRRDQLDREQRIVHRFYPWSGYVPRSEPDVSRNSILMVSWHGAPLGGINNGSSDANIRSVARKLKAMKRPILLRWAWEMNGNWFEWSGPKNGGPANYVKAYRRIHRIFDDVGASNVAWVWSPNWNSSPNTSANSVRKYYPGDSYVDWVGISGYNFYGESPSTLFNPITKIYGGRKPIILTETAAVKSKATFIKQLNTWVKKTPAVGGVVWFDTDVQHDSDHNFRFDTDSSALGAYRTMARSSRFAG